MPYSRGFHILDNTDNQEALPCNVVAGINMRLQELNTSIAEKRTAAAYLCTEGFASSVLILGGHHVYSKRHAPMIWWSTDTVIIRSNNSREDFVPPLSRPILHLSSAKKASAEQRQRWLSALSKTKAVLKGAQTPSMCRLIAASNVRLLATEVKKRCFSAEHRYSRGSFSHMVWLKPSKAYATQALGSYEYVQRYT